MLGKISQVKRGKVKAMVIRTRTSDTDLPRVLGECYGKIMKQMGASGAMAAGAPYVAYYNQDMKDMEVEIGIPTGMYVQDTDEVKMTEVPEGKYLTAIYTGPYGGLAEAYEAMTKYIQQEGLEVRGPVYESYLNDPGNTPEESLMTEILFTL